MIDFMKACINLHNMIVEDERDQQDNCGEEYEFIFEDDEHPNNVVPVFKCTLPNERYLSATTIEDLLGTFEAI